jgi:hypothetical protein
MTVDLQEPVRKEIRLNAIESLARELFIKNVNLKFDKTNKDFWREYVDDLASECLLLARCFYAQAHDEYEIDIPQTFNGE